MIRKLINTFVLSTTLLCCAAQADAAPVTWNENPVRTISVEGYAEKKLVPNRARVSFGIIGEGQSAKIAKAEHDRLMNDTVNALHALGITKEQLTTSQFSIYPIYTTPKNGGVSYIGGYRISNMLTFDTADLDLLAPAIETAINAGANTVYDIEFTVDRPADLQDTLLVAAVHNGKHRAELVAKAVGAKVGRLVSADIHTDNYGHGGGMRLFAKESAMDASPIYAGKQEVTMRIRLVFEII